MDKSSEKQSQDIEKNISEEIRLSNIRLKHALNSAKIGIHEWNIATNEFIWDERLYEFWGLPYAVPLNLELILKGVHPEDRDRIRNTTKELLEKGPDHKYSIQYRVIGIETGILRWLELTGEVFYFNGKPSKVIGIAVDITERKKDEASLKQWENIFTHAQWGTAIVSASNDKFELLNPEFASMHGYSVEELTGQPIASVFAPEWIKEIPANIALAHEKVHHVWEAEHIRKDNSRFPVNIDITTVKNEQGDPLYRIIGVTDITQRKKAEQAIIDSENHYKYLFQNLNSNFATHEIILDNKGNPVDYRFLEVNDAMEKTTGLKASEMIGKTARELFPETEQYWIEKFAEVAQTGISTVYENFSKELGRYFELKLYSPQKGEFAMLATDITERKQAELKLKESKEHFELLFNLNPDAVNLIRVNDGHIANVNQGFTIFLGYMPEEAVGKTTEELHLWANPEDRINIIHELQEHGFCNNVEVHFYRKDGKMVVGIVSAKVIDIYGTAHYLTVTRDISLRKQYENALKESEKTLKDSQKIAGLGSYKLNFQTGTWESSEILDSIFGIDSNFEKSIKGWTEIIHPDWKNLMLNYLQNEIIAKKQKFDKEYQILRINDHREIWVHGMGELLFDTYGTLLYMTGTILDITARKHAELIIQKQNSELQKLNATKDMVFSIIAHDLRSPFNSLINSNKLLSEMLAQGDIKDALYWSSVLHQISNQTLDLLENLLEWFKVQTGQLTPNISKNSIKLIVDEVVALFDEIARQKDIKIQNNIIDTKLIPLDKNITKTILRNLMNNAIKFTEHSGNISITSVRNSETAEIVISDTGIGISKETLPDLFTISKNKSTFGTANEKGTGLGLIICKDLIEAQGGKIWVESEIGKGSAFHFTIPDTTSKTS
jgi:PAS domain S-box